MRNFLLLAALYAWTASASAETVYRSAPGGTSLLELYSSEGCSDCPPADRWVGSLRGQSGLWQDFIPVVFHVDYWDYLGWRDPLASAQFSDRQRRYSRLWRADGVYTPDFILNGEDWRRRGDIPKPKGGGAGTLVIRSENRRQHLIEFKPSADAQAVWTAHAALLGFGVVSTIGAGENCGKTLRHDFVVLDYQEKILDGGKAPVLLRPNPAVKAASYGVAAWVTKGDDPRPLQAAGGELP